MASAVGTWVWVPMQRLTRPSTKWPIAIFSLVASACRSTTMASTVPPRRWRDSACSTQAKGSSRGSMKVRPITLSTMTLRPPAAGNTAAPRPGVAAG